MTNKEIDIKIQELAQEKKELQFNSSKVWNQQWENNYKNVEAERNMKIHNATLENVYKIKQAEIHKQVLRKEKEILDLKAQQQKQRDWYKEQLRLKTLIDK